MNMMDYEQVQLRPLLSQVASMEWHDSGRASSCTVDCSTLAASLGLALKGDLKHHREMPTLCVEEKMKVDKVNWLLESLGGPQLRLKV